MAQTNALLQRAPREAEVKRRRKINIALHWEPETNFVMPLHRRAPVARRLTRLEQGDFLHYDIQNGRVEVYSTP
jgi:hypothetical protein